MSREHTAAAEAEPGDDQPLQKLDYALVSSLERDPLLKERLRRLRTVPGVGPITALTWALEIGDYTRFTSNKQAISYCGLCGDEKSSADKVMRMPHLQAAEQAYPARADRGGEAGATRVTRTGDDPCQRTGKRQPQPSHARRSEEDGRLHARRRTQAAGLRACRTVPPHGSRLKTFPNKGKAKTSGFIERAGCQVPPVADWAKEQHSRRLTTNCFGTGREHKLNHLRRLSGARGSKWMSGPAWDAGTTSREALVRSERIPISEMRALPSAPRGLVFSLDR